MERGKDQGGASSSSEEVCVLRKRFLGMRDKVDGCVAGKGKTAPCAVCWKMVRKRGRWRQAVGYGGGRMTSNLNVGTDGNARNLL